MTLRDEQSSNRESWTGAAAVAQTTANVHSSYSIRIAALEDAEGVATLLRESYPKLMAAAYDAEVLAPALELMTKANPSLLKSGSYYLAELPTGHLVGCGGWTRDRPGTGTVEEGVAHLRHFAVHPDWIRHGIGRAIFSVCERAAREAGARAFECYSSLNAEKFYGALGFKGIREIDIELRPRVALRGVLMRRNL